MAVVHHSNYVRYFELARDEMMVQLGFPIERCEKELKVLVPIVSLECHFRHPSSRPCTTRMAYFARKGR